MYFYGMLAVCIISFLFIALPLKSIPSCLLGCDYYFEQGNVLFMAEHFNLGSESSTHLGHLSQGPQLYFMIASIPLMIGLDVIQTSLLLSVIGIAFSLFVYFRLFGRMFGEWKIALLCSILAFRLTTFPIFKYSEFATAFAIPLFLYVFFNYMREKSLGNAALLGIMIGVMGLSHASTFFIAYIFIGSYVLVEIIKSRDLSIIKGEWKNIAAACIIGFIISLQWWFAPIFIFKGSPYLGFGFNTYNLADTDVMLGFLGDTISGLLFNFSSLFPAIISLVNIAGIYLIYLRIKEGKLRPEIAVFLVAFLIAVFHFVITSPLLGKDLSPNHAIGFLSPILNAMFAGMIFIDEKRSKYVIPLAIAVLALNVAGLLEKPNDRFFVAGMSPLPDNYLQLGSYIKNNTDVNDVFLSTNELCFALNGLSGRKCLVMRRGHSSKFDEMDSSYVNAAIILYGTDTSEKLRLLKENNVTYLYWDDQWIRSEYYLDSTGNVGFFDPLMIIYTPEREQALNESGVIYKRGTTYLDPSFRDERFKKFDVLFVTPDNYYNATHPWNPDIDPYLQQVWNYGESAALYKVVISG